MQETICLVAAPVATDFEDPDEASSREVRETASAPKLGILTLASVLERAGMRPCIFDLDAAYDAYRAEGNCQGLGSFPAWVAPRLVSCGAGIFGFGSVCSSYPLTIRIAECVKRESPGCGILFGGPQASVVDVPTLTSFPFVDFILRGEADLTLPLFLDQRNGGRHFAAVPGLTWRGPMGPVRNPDAPPVANLDDLPLPAYHLAGGLRGAEYAFLELGRGCPFSCAFCSTNNFFRRRYRVKSPGRMLADMRTLARRYGTRSFELVHDMFTADRRKVVAFCEAMLESGEGFTWTCSARTDCVDEALLELMARAGCDGIFFGVETGSPRMQRMIGKNLDTVQARRAVEAAARLDIPTTVSLIAGFPEETEEDLRETLDVYVHSLRHPRSDSQFNVLAPLAGTRIHSEYKDRLVLEEHCSSLAYQGRNRNDADRELTQRYPEVFPDFYLLPVSGLDRPSLMELREFMMMCSANLRWLLVALHQSGPGILEVFRAWRTRRLSLHPDLRGDRLRQYYARDIPRNELVAFLRERMAEFGNAAIEALVSCQEALAKAVACAPVRPNGSPVTGRIPATGIPVRVSGLHVIELDWDIQGVIELLKQAQPPAATRKRMYYRTAEDVRGESRLVEITPLVARGLLLCDGAHTVGELKVGVGSLFECPDELRPYAAGCLLKSLRDEGLIDIHRSVTGRRRGRA